MLLEPFRRAKVVHKEDSSFVSAVLARCEDQEITSKANKLEEVNHFQLQFVVSKELTK
jgi:hypothetical protein